MNSPVANSFSARQDGWVDRVMHVDSLDDPRLDPYRNLRDRPQGRQMLGQTFVVEGRWVVQRLLQSPHAIRSVVVQTGREAEFLDQASGPVDLFSLSRDQIRELAGFDFHRGFLACAERPAVLGVDQLQPEALSLAVLEITDMENLGSMLRSAAAFGVQQILIDDASVDPLSRRSIRVSMGAALGMRWFKLSPGSELMNQLRQRGFRCLAMVVDEAAIPVGDVQPDDRPVIVLVGNEARGLPVEIAREATDRVTIAMPGRLPSIDSLNVSVAAAIGLQRISEKLA